MQICIMQIKKTGVLLICVALCGCATRHTLVKPQRTVAPLVERKGNHIWIKPGTNTTHIQIGRFSQW